jgi:hypothetical protein
MKHLTLLSATSLLLIGGTTASAAIISSGTVNIPIPTDFAGVYINIDTFVTGAAEFTGWDVNFAFGGSEIYNSDKFQAVRAGTGFTDAYLNLADGVTVSSSTPSYSTGFGGSLTHLGNGVGQFAPGGLGSIGFQFTTDDSSGPFYGYIQVKFTANTPGGVIYNWAYDDTGSPIAIPEPAALAGVAGAASLALIALRRRRLAAMVKDQAQT